MSEAHQLPPRPNLGQYKKLAKDLRSACRSPDPNAIRGWAERWAERIARLGGRPITRHVRRQIQREALEVVRRWQMMSSADRRANQCTLSDAQFFIAREHGFASWPTFSKHITALSRASSPVSMFEAAADAIVIGDAELLKKLLKEDPALARARSTREHRSTLLHYVSANGVEDFRQKTPKNIVEIATTLLDAHADVNAESEAYGGGATTLELVATSVHPERAGVQIPLLEVLLRRGAQIDRESAASKKQSLVHACLANGRLTAAEFFAARGAHVDLDAAAALGRIDIVRRCLDDQAMPMPNRLKQIATAFDFACSFGRTDVVELLLERGIDPNWRNAEGRTGLHCAAYGAHLGVICLLLQRGCPVDAQDKSFHATALDVALWVWNHDAARREQCYAVIASLARAGARLDPHQWRDADDDVGGMLMEIDRDPRVVAALRGETSDTDATGGRA